MERVAAAVFALRQAGRPSGFQEAVALVDESLLDDAAVTLRAEVAKLATWDVEVAE